jgi:hypothetical protein
LNFKPICSPNFNNVNSTEKVLSGSMAAGALNYWSDNTGDNYWGSNLYWNGNYNGWILLLDNTNTVRDFIAWNWGASSIGNITTSVGTVDASTIWTGAGASFPNNNSPYSRTGTDQNSSSGWAAATSSKNATNSGLTTGQSASVNLSAHSYYDLEINGPAMATGALNVDRNIVVNASKTLDMSTYALNVAGDITNNGTLTLTGNTTTFDGSSSQTVSGSGAFTFGGLTMNASGLILASPVTVNGVLT